MAPRPSGVASSKNSVGTFFTTSAKILKFAAPRGMFTWALKWCGMPVSAISAATKSSKRRVISFATAYSSSTRSATVKRPQLPSSAARPAATARSTSARPASQMLAMSALSTGERLSKVLPVATNSPLMKFLISSMLCVLLFESLSDDERVAPCPC